MFSFFTKKGGCDFQTSKTIVEKAPLILAEIKKADRILLHCHPSPDPDSVCSALAMKFVLEQMGKKVTLIKGDSEIPQAFGHFPGFETIVQKNFSEIDLKDFDLFIILDSGTPSQISRINEPIFPLSIKTIVIDHHFSNKGYGDINLVEYNYPATSEVLADLFSLWNVKFNRDIALNLFMGIHSDTGGFRYAGTSSHTLEIGAQLASVAPDFTKVISEMNHSESPEELKLKGLVINSIRTFLGDKVALSLISQQNLKDHGISPKLVRAGYYSPLLTSVKQWLIVGVMFEDEQGNVRASFRSCDGDKYNVSRLSVIFGGGGHKAAAGATINMPIEQAVQEVVARIKELYNL